MKMCVILKVLIALSAVYSLINVVSCDVFSCSNNDDCSSYSDKDVDSICNKSTNACECIYRKYNKAEKCTPKTIRVSNEDSLNPCAYQNTEFKNGACVTKVVILGKACDNSKQCSKSDKNSECVKGICECKEDFKNVENVCRSFVVPEKNCTENDHCIENAVCHEDKCVCNKNFISSSDFTKCLPFVAYNDKCSENRQCEMILGLGAICADNICKCNKNYTAVMNEKKEFECQKKIREGDPCNDDSECSSEEIPIMSCQNQKCRCTNGHELLQVNGENVCVKETTHALPSSSSAASSLPILKLLLSAASFITCYVIVNVL